MKDLRSPEMVGGEQLLALYRMVSYGIKNVVSVAAYQIRIEPGRPQPRCNFSGQNANPALPPDYFKVDCDISCRFATTRELQTHIYGRRFFIGIIYYRDCTH
jgi:hypothetical protein